MPLKEAWIPAFAGMTVGKSTARVLVNANPWPKRQKIQYPLINCPPNLDSFVVIWDLEFGIYSVSP
jgi:hypothetical protein